MRPTSAKPTVLSLHVFRLAALFMTAAALTGCGMGPRLIPPTSAAAIHGHVHGGQQPVAGAKIYLLAANTTGFGQPSVSLLNSSSTGYSDTLGAYVVSAADGTFDITGDYTCTSGQQLYFLALGGDSGGGPNSAIGLMALLGDCSSAPSIPFVEVNEVSTVAAAFSLAGFAADSLHIASDETASGNSTSASAHTGLVNAFTTPSNLVDLGTGLALASTPAGHGTVPQATLYTLANILASCVNTADPVQPGIRSHDVTYSSACTTLFSATTPDGGSVPTDTASAAINIAHYPAANIANLYALASSKPPFSPALASQPSAVTLTLTFTPTSLTSVTMAFDAAGDLWYTFDHGLAKLSPLGVEAAGSPFADSGLSDPSGLAIDTSSNVWVVNLRNNTLHKFNSSGSLLHSGTVTGLNEPSSIAIDPSGNLWIANYAGSVTKTNSSGTVIATYTGGGKIDSPYQVLADSAGHIWLPAFFKSYFVLLNNNGAANAHSPLSVSGVDPAGDFSLLLAAIDSTGNLWTPNLSSNEIGAISNSGVALPHIPFTLGSVPDGLSPFPEALTLDGQNHVWASIWYQSEDYGVHTGSPQPLSAHPHDSSDEVDTLYGITSSGKSLLTYNLPGPATALAVDPSGNLWYFAPGIGFYEIVGLAAPLITPTAAAVSANKIATLP
jgi:streptogramin lyase